MTPEPLPADDVLTKLPNCGEYIRFCFANVSVIASFQYCCCCFFRFLCCFLACPIYTVLVPHLGSAGVQTRDDMAAVAAQNILNILDGKPPVYSAY